MNKTPKFEVSVTQGAIQVNSVDAVQVSETAILLQADCKQKRAVIIGYSVDSDGVMSVLLDSDEYTTNVDPSHHSTTGVCVSGIDPKEWVCIAEVGRYTVTIAFVRKGNSTTTVWTE
jgi:hypothetical protein